MKHRFAVVFPFAVVFFALSACSSPGEDLSTEPTKASENSSVSNTQPQESEVPETTVRKTTTTTSTSTTLAPLPVLNRDYCTNTPVEGIFTKDGDATKGQCLHFWVNIFQFDANTGPHQFLGYYADSPHWRRWDFSDAVVKVECSDGVTSQTWRNFASDQDFDTYAMPPRDACFLLEPITQDDLVEVWAVNIGTDSYETTMGGSNSYTQFAIVDIAKYN